mgnify:CR=1 FL=1
MASTDKKQPWGDALAPFEREVNGVKATTWIDLGPVWQGDNESLQLTLFVEPYHWRSHGADRRVVIKPREQSEASRAPTPEEHQQAQRRGGRGVGR